MFFGEVVENSVEIFGWVEGCLVFQRQDGACLCSTEFSILLVLDGMFVAELANGVIFLLLIIFFGVFVVVVRNINDVVRWQCTVFTVDI